MVVCKIYKNTKEDTAFECLAQPQCNKQKQTTKLKTRLFMFGFYLKCWETETLERPCPNSKSSLDHTFSLGHWDAWHVVPREQTLPVGVLGEETCVITWHVNQHCMVMIRIHQIPESTKQTGEVVISGRLCVWSTYLVVARTGVGVPADSHQTSRYVISQWDKCSSGSLHPLTS